jgi:chaperonin GroES
MGKGDTLASGGVRATYSLSGLPKEKWSKIFGEAEKPIKTYEPDKDESSQVTESVVETPKRAPVKFRAVQDRIIVKRVEEASVTDTGIYIPEENREKPAEGIVVAVGPGRYVDGELQKINIQVGEHVFFGRFAGAEVRLGLEDYLVLREEDIFLVLEK